MEDSRIGTVLDDRYRIMEQLGTGGMGVVYRGERLKLGRSVAIKFLHAWMASDSSFLKRFDLEAKAMAKLQHPNCTSVIDFGVDGNEPYVVMDLVSGESLRALMDRGPLPTARAIEIVRQVLSGLAHAHKQGITHRDIKPDNIMVDSSPEFGDQVRILDFGLAKMREASTGLTSGFVVGTPDYMAPEQTMAEPVDERTDVYAVGVVLFEMLCGQKPFRGEGAAEVIRMHREVPPPRLSTLAPEAGFSAALEDVVARALAKSPDERYLSAAELAAALDATPEAAHSRAPSSSDAARSSTGDSNSGSNNNDESVRLGTAPTAMLDSDALIPVDSAVTAQPTTTPGSGSSPGSEPTRALTPATAQTPAAQTPDAQTPDVTAALAPAPAVSSVQPTPGAAPGLAPTPGQAPARTRRTGLIAAGVGVLAVIVALAVWGGDEPPAPANTQANEALTAEKTVSATTTTETESATEPPAPEEPTVDNADERLTIETTADTAAENSAANAEEPAELTRIKQRLEAGRTRGAIRSLEKLKRKHRSNAEIPFILGQLYFGKLWANDGIDAFRDAIALDPAYRENEDLIKSTIIGLANDKYHYRVRRFLVREIGKPAVPYLQEAASSHQSQNIRKRAQRTLRALE